MEDPIKNGHSAQGTRDSNSCDTKTRTFSKGKTYARLWNDCLQEIFSKYRLRQALVSRPGFEAINPHRITGSRQFVRVDHQRRLLIGTLGWFTRRLNNFSRFIPEETRWEALRKLQEEVGTYARAEGLPYMLIIEPEFADDPSFDYLWVDALRAWERDEEERAAKHEAAKKKDAPAQGEGSAIVHVGHDMTKTRYPLYRPSPHQTTIHRALSDKRIFSLEATSRQVMGADGQLTTIKRLPWGPMCTQIEIFLYNVYQQTNSLFVSFDWPREIVEQIGFSPQTKNYHAFRDRIMDMMHSAAYIYDSDIDESEFVSPILYASLWDKEDVKLDSKGRPNRGRGRLVQMDQKTLIPSILRLNPQWISTIALQYNKVDLNVLNKAVGSEIRYQLLLKCWELGSRPPASPDRSFVPFWGNNSVFVEFDMAKPDQLKHSGDVRKRCRRTMREAMKWVKSQTGCPFTVEKDCIRYQPWEPLLGRRIKLDVPEATLRLLRQGRDIEELIQLRKDTLARLRDERALSKQASQARGRRLLHDAVIQKSEAVQGALFS